MNTIKSFQDYEVTQEMLDTLPTPVFLQPGIIKIAADGNAVIADVLFPSNHPDIASRGHVNQHSVLASIWNTYAVRQQQLNNDRNLVAVDSHIRSSKPIPIDTKLKLDRERIGTKKQFEIYQIKLKNELGEVLSVIEVVAGEKRIHYS